MKTYKQLLEDTDWLLPDYPEQIMSKDDPEGDWVTGDSPKPIEFPPTENSPADDQHSSTARILKKTSDIIKKERGLSAD